MGTIAPLTIEIETKSPKQVIDITGQVGAMLDGAPGGTCHLYLKHTTAALTVMTWEAGVPEDIMDILQSLTPKPTWRPIFSAPWSARAFTSRCRTASSRWASSSGWCCWSSRGPGSGRSRCACSGDRAARIGRMTAAIDVPERFNAATHFLDRHLAEDRGGRTAFRFAGRAVTYAEVALRANRLGNALLARDVQMEQRVLLVLPDRPEFAEAFWGAMKIGAVPVPVSDALPADELAFMLEDSRARAVIASESAAPRILEVRERCPALRSVIVVGGRGGYKSPRWVDFVAELPKTTTGKIQRFALRQR